VFTNAVGRLRVLFFNALPTAHPQVVFFRIGSAASTARARSCSLIALPAQITNFFCFS
jgi:hypothetical protein